MAHNAGELYVKIGAKLEGLEKGIRNATSKLEKFEQKADKIGKKLTVGLTVPLAAVGTAALKMAADAVESESLFEVSMGRMADSARAWSKDLRNQLGLNEYEVRKNVGIFNVMLGSMGMTEKAAYDMSRGLTQLAYDMASFYNLPTEDAFQKLQAGISGEIEPLKRLGIIVNETTIKTWALTNGVIEQGEEMTEQQKVLARYGVIMEQTAKAQGDLARTLDSPTNQMRIFKEQVKQTAIEFGMALLPAFRDALQAAQPLLEMVKRFVAWFTALDPALQKNIVKWAAIAAIAGPALIVLSKISGALTLIISGVGGVAGIAGKLTFALSAWAGGAATAGEAVQFLGGSIIALKSIAVVGALSFVALWIQRLAKSARTARMEIASIIDMQDLVDKEKYLMDEIARLERQREGQAHLRNMEANPELLRYGVDTSKYAAEALKNIPSFDESKLQELQNQLDEVRKKKEELSKPEEIDLNLDMEELTQQINSLLGNIQTVSDDQLIKDLQDKTMRLTKEQKDYEIWALEEEAKAFRDKYKDNEAVLTAYSKYYDAAMKDIKDRHSISAEEIESTQKDLTDRIKRLTLSEKDYQIWALNEEKKEFEKTYQEKRQVLDLYAEYYKAKMAELQASTYTAPTPEEAGVIHGPQKSFFEYWWDEGLKESLENMRSWSNNIMTLASETANAMQNAFSDFFFDAFTGQLESLSDYVTSFIQSIARAMSNYLGNMATNYFMGVLFPGSIPGKALGGSVYAGEPYIVGEKGPELFVPRGNGSIVPNNKLGGNANVQVNVINETGQQVTAQKTNTKFDGEKYIVGVVLKNAANNPEFRHALGVR